VYPIDPVVLSMILAAFVVVLALAVAYLFWQQKRLKEWYRYLCDCDEAGTLADSVERSNVVVTETSRRVGALETELSDMAVRLPRAFSRVGLVRYNPFRDIGGDNSFSLVLADESGRGVVITALYTRDHSRVYAKPLDGWTSLRQLTDEEKNASEQARR
jgi:hypothetical protein